MMAEANLLGSYFRQLESHPTHRWWGRVKKSVGYLIESEGPVCSVGECCRSSTDLAPLIREKSSVSTARACFPCRWIVRAGSDMEIGSPLGVNGLPSVWEKKCWAG